MAFDKNKSMRNAERFLMHGKISSAINEYVEIVKNSPDDINSQNMLGDLYLKTSDHESAIQCYMVVANHYQSTGFHKKATSVYNKIHKLDPESAEVSLRLGELYQVQGIFAESCKHYERVAGVFEQQGKRKEAFEIWKKIAEISVRNAEVLVKLGEEYLEKGDNQSAVKAFIEAGERYKGSTNYQSAVAAYSRALEFDPKSVDALLGYVKTQVQLGFPEEAVMMLDQFFVQDSEHEEVRDMLIDCYLEIDQPKKAEEALDSIFVSDPRVSKKMLDIVDHYIKHNELDDGIRLLSKISEPIMVSKNPEHLLERATEVVTRNPEQIGALRLMVRYYSWHKDEREMKSNLEQLMHAANLNSLVEDERYAITQLLSLNPHSEKLIKRLKELDSVKSSNANKGEHKVAESVEAEEKREVVPTFEAFSGLLNGNGGDGSYIEDAVAEFGTKYNPDIYPTIALTNEDLSHTEAVTDIEEKQEFEIENSGGSKLSKESIEDTNEDTNEDSKEHSKTQSKEEDPTSTNSEIEDKPTLSKEEIAERVDNLQFYIDQGYLQVAVTTIREYDEEFGILQELAEIRELLERKNAFEDYPPEEASKDEKQESNDVAEKITAEEEKEAEAFESDEDKSGNDLESKTKEDQEVDVESAEERVSDVSNKGFAFGNSLDSEAGDYLQPNQVDKKPKEADNKVKSAIKKPKKGATTGKPAVVPIDATPLDEKIDLNTLEKDTAKENLVKQENNFSDEEYDTHYHHAIAYQEMGLCNDAIREFQAAIEVVDPKDGTGRYFQCCTLIAHCHKDLNIIDQAIEWFKKAAGLEDLTPVEQVAVQYELASVYHSNDECERALELFEKVSEMNSEYRDVAYKLEQCRKHAELAMA